MTVCECPDLSAIGHYVGLVAIERRESPDLAHLEEYLRQCGLWPDPTITQGQRRTAWERAKTICSGNCDYDCSPERLPLEWGDL